MFFINLENAWYKHTLALRLSNHFLLKQNTNNKILFSKFTFNGKSDPSLPSRVANLLAWDVAGEIRLTDSLIFISRYRSINSNQPCTVVIPSYLSFAITLRSPFLLYSSLLFLFYSDPTQRSLLRVDSAGSNFRLSSVSRLLFFISSVFFCLPFFREICRKISHCVLWLTEYYRYFCTLHAFLSFPLQQFFSLVFLLILAFLQIWNCID